MKKFNINNLSNNFVALHASAVWEYRQSFSSIRTYLAIAINLSKIAGFTVVGCVVD
jgi:hypothetical protein